jgi:hypothetical protein
MKRPGSPLVAFFLSLVIVLLITSLSVYGVDNVISFFKVVGAVLVFLWLAYKVTTRRSGRTRPETPLYSERALDRPLGGTATAISPATTRIDTREGTSFVVSQQAGDVFYVQQIDPDSGRYVGQPFLGQNKYGQPDAGAVSRFIKRRTRGG